MTAEVSSVREGPASYSSNRKQRPMGKHKSREYYGSLFAALSFIIWGFLVFYWKILHHVPAFQLILHRVVWCFVLMFILTLVRGRFRELVKVLAIKKNIVITALTGVLVTLNWFIYVFAVTSGQVLQASMGYYINPLMSIFLGLVFLREKLTRREVISLVSACIGVAVITIGSGIFPWISISLAISFSVYGFIKKTVHIPTDISLTLETMFITPAAVFMMFFLQARGDLVFLELPAVDIGLLIGAGVVTALPLFLFSEATKRIALSRVGFIQFITPSLMFLIGALVYGEDLTAVKIISFIFIWIALGLFLVPDRSRRRTGQKQ